MTIIASARIQTYPIISSEINTVDLLPSNFLLLDEYAGKLRAAITSADCTCMQKLESIGFGETYTVY